MDNPPPGVMLGLLPPREVLAGDAALVVEDGEGVEVPVELAADGGFDVAAAEGLDEGFALDVAEPITQLLF